MGYGGYSRGESGFEVTVSGCGVIWEGSLRFESI